MNAAGSGLKLLVRGADTQSISAGTAGAPQNLSLPELAGEARVGQYLSATAGVWHGVVPLTTAFSWQRCLPDGGSCTDIAGASDSFYKLDAADLGKRIVVVATTTNASGSLGARSAPSAVVTAQLPRVVSRPSIVGSPIVGAPVAATLGVWTSSPSAYAFAWLRCDQDLGASRSRGRRTGPTCRSQRTPGCPSRRRRRDRRVRPAGRVDRRAVGSCRRRASGRHHQHHDDNPDCLDVDHEHDDDTLDHTTPAPRRSREACARPATRRRTR